MSLLYAHGHANARHYTPGQVRLYLEAIWRDERMQKRQRIIEMRIAQADDEGFKKAMRSLAKPDPDTDD